MGAAAGFHRNDAGRELRGQAHDSFALHATPQNDFARGIKPGDAATFTVDAFAKRIFRGAVRQVRQSPQTVQNVVSTRTTLPILSNVLLQANGSEVHVTTTDLDVGVRGSFEAQVEKEGATSCRRPARWSADRTE